MAMMTPELKAKLAEYSKQKRTAHPLLKDVTPMLLAIFARDHFDEYWNMGCGETIKEDGLPSSVAYLSRASKEQVAALVEYLPHKRIIVGSRVGNRIVTVFSEARLRHALDQLQVDHEGRYDGLNGGYRSKYIRRVKQKDMVEATPENCERWGITDGIIRS